MRLDPRGCDGLAPEPMVSVDGSLAPATLDGPAGQLQLLRLIDATSDSPKRLQLRDAAGRVQPLHVVGLDGIPVSGNMAEPLTEYLAMDYVMVAPMARADVLIDRWCRGNPHAFQRALLRRCRRVFPNASRRTADPWRPGRSSRNGRLYP